MTGPPKTRSPQPRASGEGASEFVRWELDGSENTRFRRIPQPLRPVGPIVEVIVRRLVSKMEARDGA